MIFLVRLGQIIMMMMVGSTMKMTTASVIPLHFYRCYCTNLLLKLMSQRKTVSLSPCVSDDVRHDEDHDIILSPQIS